MKTLPQFKHIFVEEGSEDYRITQNLLSRYPRIKPKIVSDGSEAFLDLAKISADPIGEGKKRLFIGRQKGAFLKKCPGTKNMVCCNYYVLNLATQCSLDCSYCILQEYFRNNPALKVFCNIRDCFSEIEDLIRSRPNATLRIGTGEFTDSLALDEIAGFSNELVPFFLGKKNLILELKTKTTSIANLLKYDNASNVVIAWSINPDTVIEQEEEGAAKVKERIEAARECMEKGYRLAFHFDPVILYDGWEEGYKGIVDLIFRHVDARKIAWISVGGLRYRPSLKEVIRERFPKSRLLTGEHILGEDGKMRYLKSLRVSAYRKIVEWIRAGGPSVRVYLCMESREIWRKIFNMVPKCQEKPDLLFDGE